MPTLTLVFILLKSVAFWTGAHVISVGIHASMATRAHDLALVNIHTGFGVIWVNLKPGVTRAAGLSKHFTWHTFLIAPKMVQGAQGNASGCVWHVELEVFMASARDPISVGRAPVLAAPQHVIFWLAHIVWLIGNDYSGRCDARCSCESVFGGVQRNTTVVDGPTKVFARKTVAIDAVAWTTVAVVWPHGIDAGTFGAYVCF